MTVRESTITIPSQWGRPAVHRLERRANSSGLAVIFPGSSYPVDAPLLHYARRAALANRFDVLSLEYGFQANRADVEREDFPTMAEEAMQAIATVAREDEPLIFVSKSLGTVVGTQVQRQLASTRPMRHHLFLTPLAAAIDVMKQTEHAMVVVGTADPLFGRDDIKAVEALGHVDLHAVTDANHALEVEDYGASVRILYDVAEWCGHFFQQVPSV